MTTSSEPFPLAELESFIVKAKAATYVGAGKKSPPCRPGSLDLHYQEGDYAYLDSYFGNADFSGQEVIYYREAPVWIMNYYGRILEPELIEAAQAGQVIQASLSRMYQEGRFLGGFEHEIQGYRYVDSSQGDTRAFTGQEWITRENIRVYELVYHGGLIK